VLDYQEVEAVSDDSAHIKAIVDAKKKRLNVLLKQQAVYGIDSPAHIVMEIEDLRQEIAQLEGQIEDRESTADLIEIKTRRLRELQLRAAKYGVNCPPEITLEIEILEQEIEKLREDTPLSDIPERKSTRSSENISSGKSHVFISYSHRDARWLQRLQVHLKPLERLGKITLWDDTHIDPGKKWLNEIRKALGSAKAAILLISADFLASDFIAKNEIPPLLASAESRGAVILPVIVSTCRFSQTESLSQFQAVNPPNQPLNMMSKGRQEAVFVKVSEAVEKALKL